MTFPVPVPQPRPYTDAREAYLYGVFFVALALSAYYFRMLIFSFIEQAFPLTDSARSLRDSTRWPISVQMVAQPAFFSVSRVVNGEVRSDPSERASKSRSQLTYITRFVRFCGHWHSCWPGLQPSCR